MKIALSQMNCYATKAENLKKIISVLHACQGKADFAVFPEYSMGVSKDGLPRDLVEKSAEVLDGEFVGTILDASASTGVSALVPIYELDKDAFYDTAVFLENGRIGGKYRKIHLFNALGFREGEIFASGNEVVSFSLGEWNFGIIICYDVRFPELSRLLALNGSNVLVVPAGWYRGIAKEETWLTFLRARALENTVYVAGVGNCAPAFIGRSCFVGPDGIIDLDLGGSERLAIAELDKTRLEKVRESMPVLSQSAATKYNFAKA
jgi:deaminated glutathione amidase